VRGPAQRRGASAGVPRVPASAGATTCRSLASLARVFEAAPWCADPVLCAYGVVNTYPHDPVQIYNDTHAQSTRARAGEPASRRARP